MMAAVIIPVAGDTSGLKRTLEAIGRLDERRLIRVIVAVDGHEPATELVARELADEVVLLAENQGSYAARNAAVDHVVGRAGDVQALLFTDAGCLPLRGWVAGHLERLEECELSGGAIHLTYASNRPTPAAYLDRLWHLDQERYVRAQSFAATANLAVAARVFGSLRFDASRRSGGDRDFCRRAVAAGHSIGFTPQAIVDHPARTTASELRAKITRIAAGVAVTPRHELPPPVPQPSLRYRARLLAGAVRAGAVRGVGDAAELFALDRFRREQIGRARAEAALRRL